MYLSGVVVPASLTARQIPTGTVLIPKDFCSPQCPQCRTDFVAFSESTSCVTNSSFITNCGSCQLCILTFEIENPNLPNIGTYNSVVEEVLDRCLNTTASDAIVALQSQASRISLIGVELTSGATGATASPQVATRTFPTARTWTGTPNPSWTTILSTATWASAYYSWKSAESVASVAAASVLAGKYNLTAVGEGSKSQSTAIPTAPITTAPADAVNQPANMTWVIGPVIGSILGMVTVFIVIYFTRRKQRLDTIALEGAARKVTEEEDDSGDSIEGKAQLHSESVEVKELESIEVHEMAAVEPVGSELNTPRDTTMDPIEDWPLPMSPLPLLFAMSEMRDERAASNNSPKHSTYYNP